LHSSKYARRCGLAYRKGKKDIEEHPESLSTHGQHLCKRLLSIASHIDEDVMIVTNL
jgi:hypothetical protein